MSTYPNYPGSRPGPHAATHGPGGTDPINLEVLGITPEAIGLGNVDNTSDANKPISTATQTALDAKASTTALTAETAARESDPIGYLGNLISEGTSVAIDCRGDSTYFGYISGGVTADPAPPAAMQSALRSYYNNTAATVVNNGVSGNGTTDVISGWAAAMAASSASIVLIAYGTNDATGAGNSAGITATQYANNLRTMVLQARATGKIVVFETPLPILAYGDLGTQVRAERVKHFAEGMREIGRQMSVPTIDTWTFFTKYLAQGVDVSTIVNDGIHLTQAGYTMRGYWMANLFMRAPALGRFEYAPASLSPFRRYEGENLFYPAPGSKMARALVARKLRLPVQITAPGTDIYIATAIWQAGSDSVSVTINGTSIGTINMQATILGNDSFAVDQEVMVMESAPAGFYLIELTTATSDASIYYARTSPTRKQATLSGFNTTGVAPSISATASFGSLRMVTDASSTDQNHAITEIPFSCFVSARTIEFDAAFSGNSGISLFCTRRADAASPRGGVTVFLDNSTGYVTAAEGTSDFYQNVSAIGSVDLRGVLTAYRIDVATTGVLSIYVDGSLIGTYDPTLPYIGGVIGLYAYGASKTVEVNNLRLK